jgi:hypothetical protein
MWFQDLFNYDFRRTEMCIIPYGTQEGEISFCAYNTGVGWRNIIEHMHQNATVAQWYKEHGRHEVFAKGKEVALSDKSHNLILNEVDLSRPEQTGNGRTENRRRRNADDEETLSANGSGEKQYQRRKSRPNRRIEA